ncbi:MAG: SDR family NAD(P)-dependent oxidoreductase [Pseudomonadota bacterium]
MRAVVIGASGGVGNALTKKLLAAGYAVHALSRSGVTEAQDAVPGRIDITDETSISAAVKSVAEYGQPDLVLVASGILSADNGLQPEKSLRHQEMDAFARVFAINTFGPGLVAKHFIPAMPKKDRAVFAAISARVGSISDNQIGGWHAYRASKAALNMLIRNYAIEQRRRNPRFIAVGLHPGTVDTALSKPFQSNVPDGKLFTSDQSAGYLLDVISQLTPDDSGKVFDWKGNEIPA